MKRRHSLSTRRTIRSTFERCYNDHFNECCTNGLNCFSDEQIIQQRSHSAPPDYQEMSRNGHQKLKGLLKEHNGKNAARRRKRRKSKKIKQKKIVDKKKDRRDRGCGIPGRWLDYSVSVGLRPIEGTRFIAFKTPLHPYYFASDVTQKYRFDIDTIVSCVAAQNKTLGLVIDLTDTNRYYDPSRWKTHQIGYNKLNCPGHQVNRNELFFETFLQLIKKFIFENIDNGFGEARGYPIERGAYIQSLHNIEKMMNPKRL
uniref:Uncharacterized protein n=1 Tax=Meloidogyne hapla TaxID=6305 RepID=A0A1I8BCW7_MELHA